jgi:hypothetical protein
MNGQVPPWRQIITDQLRVLASDTAQLEYERRVPHVDISTELLCQWFDDSYHPDDPGFRSSFSSDELNALAEFNALFEERDDSLPESAGTVATWHASPTWREVMDAASKTLARIAV